MLLIPSCVALVCFSVLFCKFNVMNITTSGLQELNYSLFSPPTVCVCVHTHTCWLLHKLTLPFLSNLSTATTTSNPLYLPRNSPCLWTSFFPSTWNLLGSSFGSWSPFIFQDPALHLLFFPCLSSPCSMSCPLSFICIIILFTYLYEGTCDTMLT